MGGERYMVRMRTIATLVDEIKKEDPNTHITTYWVRQQVKIGNLKYHKAGRKVLIDCEFFYEFLKNPPQFS